MQIGGMILKGEANVAHAVSAPTVCFSHHEWLVANLPRPGHSRFQTSPTTLYIYIDKVNLVLFNKEFLSNGKHSHGGVVV